MGPRPGLGFVEVGEDKAGAGGARAESCLDEPGAYVRGLVRLVLQPDQDRNQLVLEAEQNTVFVTAVCVDRDRLNGDGQGRPRK